MSNTSCATYFDNAVIAIAHIVLIQSAPYIRQDLISQELLARFFILVKDWEIRVHFQFQIMQAVLVLAEVLPINFRSMLQKVTMFIQHLLFSLPLAIL